MRKGECCKKCGSVAVKYSRECEGCKTLQIQAFEDSAVVAELRKQLENGLIGNLDFALACVRLYAEDFRPAQLAKDELYKKAKRVAFLIEEKG